MDQWDKEDRDAYEKEKAQFRTDAANIFKEKIPWADRVEKLNQLLQTTKTEYQDKWKEYKESQTGLGNDGNQVRIGDDNNQGKTTEDKEDKDNKEKNEVPSDYKISAEKRIPDLNKLKTYLSDMKEDNKQSFVFQTPRELINSLEGGLDGRGNPQQNSSLVTAARTETLYSSPILAHQLNQIEDLAIVLENKNMDGNSLNVWGWIQGADAIDVDSFPKEPLKIERDGFLILPHENNRIPPGPRALSYTREMPAILGRINKDMSPKEYFINQAKLHNLPLTPKFYERLDRVFPDERNDQFQFEEVKKNNKIGSTISDQETLIASTDLSGILKKESTPPPRIDPSEDKDLYPEGIETGNYKLPKHVTRDKEFVSAVEKLSTELKIPVNYLWAVMGFETGGTYNPAEYNKGPDGTKESGSKAVGLIQFMPATLKEWGVTTEQAAKMTRVEQLELVKKHLKRWTRPGDDFRDVYMSILFPVAAGKPNDYVLFTKGTKEKPNISYNQNIGLDKNKDGTITKEEAASSILQYLPPLPIKEVPKNKESSIIETKSNIA